MDDRQFDAFVRSLAQSGSRRALIKTALGLSGLAAAAAVLHDTDAARRGYSGPPIPGPQPTSTEGSLPIQVPSESPPMSETSVPQCPQNQIPCGAGCCCPDGSATCGFDCCPDGQAECCGGSCCYGNCVGNELCCPAGQPVCTVDGCCLGQCVGQGQFCCPTANVCGDACCTQAERCCSPSDGDALCIPETDCCTDADCAEARCIEGACVPYTPTVTPTNTPQPPPATLDDSVSDTCLLTTTLQHWEPDQLVRVDYSLLDDPGTHEFVYLRADSEGTLIINWSKPLPCGSNDGWLLATWQSGSVHSIVQRPFSYSCSCPPTPTSAGTNTPALPTDTPVPPTNTPGPPTITVTVDASDCTMTVTLGGWQSYEYVDVDGFTDSGIRFEQTLQVDITGKLVFAWPTAFPCNSTWVYADALGLIDSRGVHTTAKFACTCPG